MVVGGIGTHVLGVDGVEDGLWLCSFGVVGIDERELDASVCCNGVGRRYRQLPRAVHVSLTQIEAESVQEHTFRGIVQAVGKPVRVRDVVAGVCQNLELELVLLLKLNELSLVSGEIATSDAPASLRSGNTA